jgi:serine/threonine protein kinase
MSVQRAGSHVGTLLQRRYRITARIASGGMGTVYRGWDERLDRAVALKLLHPHLAEDDEVRDRFRAEARHAARVRHPNVVAVLDQDEHDDTQFIVMELADGPSLRDLLTDRSHLEPTALVTFLTGVCAGLEAVHDAGLVHRDIKPENLLQDATGQIRVADFGIARALDSTWLTPAGSMVGSVQYMAPEVVLGQRATRASDQYSLGIVAFEALTGRTPLPADVPMAAALRHAREHVPPPSSMRPHIPSVVDAVVMRATAKDPRDRFESLDALLEALRTAVDAPVHRQAAPQVPRRTAVLPPPATTARRRRPTARQASPPHPVPTAASDRHPPATASDRHPPATAADRQAPAAAAGQPTLVAERTVYVRSRMSLLALLSLAFTLVQIGAFVAPVLGFVALRRIDRSRGALRGETLAGLAILLGLARLGWRLLNQ